MPPPPWSASGPREARRTGGLLASRGSASPKRRPLAAREYWESSPPFRSVRASAQNARGSSPHGLSPKSHGCGSEGEKPAKNEREANPGAQTSPALALPAPASCWCLPCRGRPPHGPTAPRADQPTLLHGQPATPGPALTHKLPPRRRPLHYQILHQPDHVPACRLGQTCNSRRCAAGARSQKHLPRRAAVSRR